MRWNLAWLTLMFTVVCTTAVSAAPTQLVPETSTPPQSRYAGQSIGGDASEAAPSAENELVAEKSEGWVGMARTGAALAFVITLVLLLGWGYRKLSGDNTARGPSAATVLARNPVSPRAGVVLLKVGRRVLVCSESAGQPLTTLSEITDRDEVAELEGRLSGRRSEPETPFVMSMSSAESAYGGDYPDPADSEVAAALGSDLDAGDLDEGASDPIVDETKGELAGLMERVRTISKQLRTTNQRGHG